MKILLQIPAGFNTKALEIAAQLEAEGNQVFISGENVYGACDLREEEAKLLEVDKIIQYGHTRFMKSDIPVEYREVRENINVIPILEKQWEKITEKQICLLTSLQFVDTINTVKKFLQSKGKEIIVSEGIDADKKLYCGQILGCTITLPKAQAYLYIGSGSFHATSKNLIGKSVYALDVERQEIRKVDSSLLEKQKYAAIGLSKQAKTFGILVSTRRGQFNLNTAEHIKKKLESQNKQGFIIVLDEITPDKLLGIKCDCWINTACPRIAVDNRSLFSQPIINWDELTSEN